jgi:microcystin-dependent protein
MRSKKLTLGLLATAAASCYSAPALAQGADPFLGQLMLTPYNFCPRGWSTAAGQILSIAQNTALFSLLGTTYGGNGQTTFALPDLQGRVPNSTGQGPGLSNYSLGQVGGVENTTLTQLQMPIHTHVATAVSLIKIAANQVADTNKPGGNAFANTGSTNVYFTGPPTANFMDNDNVQTTVTNGTAGGSQPFSILQPYLTLQWCISLQGIFPSRN